MFRKLTFLICIVGLLTPLRLGWGEDYSFRNARWGMTKEEVTASEIKMDPVEINENTIMYKTQILGKNVELIYLFSQNQLAKAAYKLDDNYLNSGHFFKHLPEIQGGSDSKIRSADHRFNQLAKRHIQGCEPEKGPGPEPGSYGILRKLGDDHFQNKFTLGRGKLCCVMPDRILEQRTSLFSRRD